MPEISVMIDGGKATAAAPLGPALGPLGVNIGDVVNKINEKTKNFVGMKVPVKVKVDADKNIEIEVGSPPTSALIKKELGIEKGAGNPKAEPVAEITIEQLKKVAEMKMDSMSSSNMKASVLEVLGTCNSLGVTIDGVRAKDFIKRVKEGEFDSQLR